MAVSLAGALSTLFMMPCGKNVHKSLQVHAQFVIKPTPALQEAAEALCEITAALDWSVVLQRGVEILVKLHPVQTKAVCYLSSYSTEN